MSSLYDRKWPLIVVVEGLDSPTTSHTDINRCAEANRVTIHVRGDYTIGQVMVCTTACIATNHDWSDYAFWWPEKKKWLKQTRMTLDQADVHANCELHFTNMHKTLRIQMPDRTIVEMLVDFSVNLLSAMSQLCSTLQIRHSEELSFARPLTSKQLKRNNPNQCASPLQRPSTPTDKQLKSPSKSNLNGNGTLSSKSNGSLLNDSFTTISSNNSLNSSNYSLSSPDASRAALLRPKSAIEKARLNSAWLNSSVSLLEQDVCAYDLLLLKYKFFDFFDLNPKLDVARINYIYEQFRWAIVSEEFNCTEDDMYTLAGIALQVTMQSGAVRNIVSRPFNNTNRTVYSNTTNRTNGSTTYDSPQPNGYLRTNSNGNGHLNGHSSSLLHPLHEYGHLPSNGVTSAVDEIDSALEDLEKTLEGTYVESKSTNGFTNGKHMNGQNNLLVVPELRDKLKISCQKGSTKTATLSRLKFLTTQDKAYSVVLRDTTLLAYKFTEGKENQPKGEPSFKLNINTCEVNADVSVSQRKYCFQIIESRPEGVIEYWVRCRDEKQYAEWFTACKQASIGRTMAHASYNDEVKKTLRRLQIQTNTTTTKSTANGQIKSPELDNFPLEDLVPSRFLKRRSKEQIVSKIKSIYVNFANDTLIEAQMNFIKTCQSLRDYGITLFVIRFSKSKKEDLLGVTINKLMRFDINTGSLLKSWRFNTLIDWNVNWEVKKMQINFSNEDIEFECLSADCKVIHEYIGGYIYMSMRSKDNDKLNETEFLKLTGGWNELDHSEEENGKVES